MKTDLAKLVDAELTKQNKKAVDLAEEMKVSKAYVSMWLGGKTEYDPVDALIKVIASFLGLKELDLMRKAVRPKSRTLTQTSIHLLAAEARERQSNLDKLKEFLNESVKKDITDAQWKKILSVLSEE